MVVIVFRSVRDRKRRLAKKLLECARYLQPGIWLLREPRIAHYALQYHRPASLRDTKSLRSSGVRGVRRIVHRLLFCITPPFLVRVGLGSRNPQSGRHVATFPILVLARNGDAILIDHDRREVVRVSEERRTGKVEIDIRERLSRFLEVPILEVMDGGKAERESYVEGQSFVTTNSAVRIKTAGILLHQYEKLTMDEKRPAPTMFWEQVTDYAKSLPLPESASRRADTVVSVGFRQLPFTPAHGDLSGSNILLRNGMPSLIDLADCAWLPAFFDFYFLNHQELLAGRSDLWRYFVIGDGWSSVKTALSGSGAGSIDRNEWLVSSFFMECFMWGRKKGARRLDEPTLRKWWLPVGDVLTDPRDRRAEANGTR